MLYTENKTLAAVDSHCSTMKIRVFPVNKRMVEKTRTDQGTASINVAPRSKQSSLPALLPTMLAQTRVLEQYNVKNTKY